MARCGRLDPLAFGKAMVGPEMRVKPTLFNVLPFRMKDSASPFSAGGGGSPVWPEGEESRLWGRAAARMAARSLDTGRALLFGFSPEDLSVLREDLRGMGFRVAAAATRADQILDLSGMSGIFSHILLNFDDFPDVETGVSALLSFRSEMPDVVVVLLSRQVAGDDLSLERATICDATLRLPVTRQRLLAGILTAAENNLNRSGAPVQPWVPDGGETCDE